MCRQGQFDDGSPPLIYDPAEIGASVSGAGLAPAASRIVAFTGTFTAWFNTPGFKLGTHPYEVADRRLHRSHRNGQIRDGFTVHLPLFVHDDQVRDLLGHRLQDTLDGLGVKDRHRERVVPQPWWKKKRLVAPAAQSPSSVSLLSSSRTPTGGQIPGFTAQVPEMKSSCGSAAGVQPPPVVNTSANAGLRSSVSSHGATQIVTGGITALHPITAKRYSCQAAGVGAHWRSRCTHASHAHTRTERKSKPEVFLNYVMCASGPKRKWLGKVKGIVPGF